MLLLDDRCRARRGGSGRLRADLATHVREFGGATVLVTHSPADAAALADSVLVLERGGSRSAAPSMSCARRPRRRMSSGCWRHRRVRLPGGVRRPVHRTDSPGSIGVRGRRVRSSGCRRRALATSAIGCGASTGGVCGRVGEVVVAGGAAGRPSRWCGRRRTWRRGVSNRGTGSRRHEPAVSGEIGGHPVALAAVGEVRAGLGWVRMRRNDGRAPRAAGRCRRRSGRTRRARRARRCAEQGEHRHGDEIFGVTTPTGESDSAWSGRGGDRLRGRASTGRRGRSATESATCLASASASRCAMIATPRSASRYRLSQAMPSSTGSRQTRRSSAARCAGRRAARDASAPATVGSAAGTPTASPATPAPARRPRTRSSHRRQCAATSSSDRTRLTQIDPPASAASVAPNSPVNRRASATSPPAVASCTTSVVATRRRTRGSRTPDPPATRHPSPPRPRPRARVPLRCGGTARPAPPGSPDQAPRSAEFGIEHRLERGSRTGGHGTTQPPPTDIRTRRNQD